jgi:hypothetical protein
MRLLDEVDTTEKIYNEKMAQKENTKNDIITSKLKPKGGKVQS